MGKIQTENCFSNFNKVFEILFSLESIIKLTYNYCQNKELESIYYNLSEKERYILSEERNHYINMLSLALEKIIEAKKTNNKLEEDFFNLKQDTYNCGR